MKVVTVSIDRIVINFKMCIETSSMSFINETATSMVDGRGKKTEYRPGSFGLLLETIDAVGRSTLNQFDLTLNTVETVDRNGQHIRYIYDNRNLLVSQSVS
jgi:uncharacterized protein RhaS with RHS repeats